MPEGRGDGAGFVLCSLGVGVGGPWLHIYIFLLFAGWRANTHKQCMKNIRVGLRVSCKKAKWKHSGKPLQQGLIIEHVCRIHYILKCLFTTGEAQYCFIFCMLSISMLLCCALNDVNVADIDYLSGILKNNMENYGLLCACRNGPQN